MANIVLKIIVQIFVLCSVSIVRRLCKTPLMAGPERDAEEGAMVAILCGDIGHGMNHVVLERATERPRVCPHPRNLRPRHFGL